MSNIASGGMPATQIAALRVAADVLALAAIKAADSDHNGQVSKDEALHHSPGIPSTADKNGDGQVSVGELANAYYPGMIDVQA